LAVANKSKKKKSGAGAKPTYAKGKTAGIVKSKSDMKKTASKPSSRVTGPKGGAAQAGAGGKKRSNSDGSNKFQSRFNLIQSGTLEMRVFQVLLVFVIISILVQYPLWKDVLGKEYQNNVKQYRLELEKWEKEHESIKNEKKKEEHEKEKPIKPVKPTFSVFIFYYLLMSLIQGALFLFIGLNIARRTDLKTPVLDGLFSGERESQKIPRLLMDSLLWGLVIFMPLGAVSLLGKFAGITRSTEMEHAFWKYSLHYAGFAAQNQFLFLILIFSGLVWVFTRYKEKVKFEPHIAGVTLTAIIAFLYFFQVSRGGEEKITSVLLVSFFFVVSLVVIAGLLYWKKGLELSLISSFVGFALYPIFYSVIM